MPPKVEARLQALEDREAIRELILKHAETPGAAEPGQENTAFDLVISGRITRHDKA